MGIQLLKISLFFVLLTLFVNVNASDSTEEARALLKWKASLHSKTKPLLPSWMTLHPKTKTSPCTWFGISCHGGRVSAINLVNSGLNGTLHELSFSSFPNLSYFNLTMNELHGSIPDEISQLSELVYLDLSSNQFTGKIPSSIGLLIHIQVLNLSGNKLSDSVPASLGDLSKLTDLHLYNNSLSGSIPPKLSRLSKLVYHDLWYGGGAQSKTPGPGGR